MILHIPSTPARLLLSLVPALTLAACQSVWGPAYIPEEIKRIEMQRTVVIAAGTARAVFQQGEPAPRHDPYRPYCELEVSGVSEQPQQLAPDMLTVTSGGTAILSDPDARLPLFGSFGDVPCGDPIHFEVAYRLASERQSGIRHLRCRQAFRACIDVGRYPSREDIAEALGDGFAIE